MTVKIPNAADKRRAELMQEGVWVPPAELPTKREIMKANLRKRRNKENS